VYIWVASAGGWLYGSQVPEFSDCFDSVALNRYIYCINSNLQYRSLICLTLTLWSTCRLILSALSRSVFNFPNAITSMCHSLHHHHSIHIEAPSQSELHLSRNVLLFCTVTDYTVRDVSALKPAVQVSGQFGQNPPRYANDGSEQTCAASETETNPWWAVKLGGPTLVFMVKLTNSRDAKGNNINLAGYVILNAATLNRVLLTLKYQYSMLKFTFLYSFC